MFTFIIIATGIVSFYMGMRFMSFTSYQATLVIFKCVLDKNPILLKEAMGDELFAKITKDIAESGI